MNNMSRTVIKKNKRYDLKDGHKGTCENCGEETWVRPVEVFSVFRLGREQASRGFYKICFKCQSPRMIWNSKQHGEMKSPVYDMSWETIDEYFKNKGL